MKIPPARADAFVSKPDPAVKAVLVYGPDAGLVRERADRLARTVVDNLSDPFRVCVLDPGVLKKDPTLLEDEVRAMAFTGGRRVVRVSPATDALAGIFKDFLEGEAEGALVVLDGGELGPRSNLRKVFEAADQGAAMACYPDDARNLPGVIRGILQSHGLEVGPDALAFLAANLGADRSLTRRELEKLALYVGESRKVELADAAACVGDSAASGLDDIVFSAAGGNAGRLDVALRRGFAEGVQAIVVLRAAQRHLHRLHLARGFVDAGNSADAAVKKLRPPVIFKVADEFKRQVSRWDGARLAAALEILTEAEVDCKTTGMPSEAICARALMRVAQAGRR